MTNLYQCSVCGQSHDGAPLSWGPEAPTMWADIAPLERDQRGELGTDSAVIDGKHFFIKGRIEIPVIASDNPFAWLVWVKVGLDDFSHMGDLWTVQGREAKAPLYDGLLANSLPLYSEETLGLRVKLHTRPVGERPFIEIVGDHKLREEQLHGISLHYVQEIADTLLN